jgi:3-phenylpropionate/trans-cinnamate dioxygenase ferredoxin reductase subunit
MSELIEKNRKSIFWAATYLLWVFAPIIILLLEPKPEGREFLREVAVMFGFAGLSLMGFQYIPVIRLPLWADDLPFDTIYLFHHRLSIVSLLFCLAHPLLLLFNNPYIINLFDLRTAPDRARAATLALIAMIILVLGSIWRKQLSLKYEPWRLLHGIFAAIATVLAMYHIFGVNYYMASTIQRVLWGGLFVIWFALLAYVRIIKPYRMLQRPYEVVEVIRERGESWTLAIEPIGHSGMEFMPGQIAWITVGRSPFHIREHPFSIASSAERPEHIEFTIRELGDFTNNIKDIPIGEKVYLDGPYSTFSIDKHTDAPGYIFIAGGIGIAPIMGMLRTLADRGDKRPVQLYYGNWNLESATFLEEIESLEEKLNIDVIHVLEKPEEDWEGETGFITANLLDKHLPKKREGLVYFICGPLPMIDAVEPALRSLDIPLTHIHAEQYFMA